MLKLDLRNLDDGLDVRQLQEIDAEDLSACSVGYNSAPQVNEWWFRDAREFILEGLDKASQGIGLSAGIWYENRLVGIICLALGQESRAGKADDSTARIDYGLMPAHRGKGIMIRACRAMVEYAFNRLKVDRIEITPDTANTKSCAIPERLGFRKERVVERAVHYAPDLIGDLAVYAISREDWSKTRGT